MDSAYYACVLVICLSMPWKTCQQHRLGEPCDDDDRDDDCDDDETKLECKDDICVCNEDFPTWNDKLKVCHGKLYHEPCGHLSNVCERDLAQRNITLLCVNGRCECINGKPLVDNVTGTCFAQSKFGESCSRDEVCEHPEILKCVNSFCACPNAAQELVETTCQTRAQKPWNARCHKPGGQCTEKLNFLSNDYQCNAERNLVCDSRHSYCRCKDKFIWNDDQKLCKSNFNSDVACPERQEYSQGSMTCERKAGEPCFEDGVLRHERCASGICLGEDTTQEGLENRCACANDSGYKQYWSPSGRTPGCLLNYSDLSCSRAEGNKTCGPSGILQNGLACLEKNGGWFCACEKSNHVYYDGLCVEANKTHGESCDRSEGTCKVDLSRSLVCKKGKCECLPMRMNSTDGKVIFTALDWDATAQKCELKMKEDGAGCRSSAECAGGQCNLSKCVPSRAGVQIHGTEFVIISGIFIALQ